MFTHKTTDRDSSDHYDSPALAPICIRVHTTSRDPFHATSAVCVKTEEENDAGNGKRRTPFIMNIKSRSREAIGTATDSRDTRDQKSHTRFPVPFCVPLSLSFSPFCRPTREMHRQPKRRRKEQQQ